MELTARSMASVWMVGIEDEPRRSGEICVFEVFGGAIDRRGPAVGMGIHPFRDPALREDFAAPRLPVDVTEFHVYATGWRPGGVDFFVDGDHVRTVEQAPDYPMQMMIGVFDFPARSAAAVNADHVPLFAIDYVREA
jgi:beta-glucanase (GH16 family)